MAIAAPRRWRTLCSPLPRNSAWAGFLSSAPRSAARRPAWLAVRHPARISALVLELPVAMRPARPAGAAKDATSDPARDPALEQGLRGLLDMPVLVLFGTRDTISAPETGRLYKDLIPDAHLVFVYGAGHAIAAERAAAFAEVVFDFLERSHAFVINRARTVIFD